MHSGTPENYEPAATKSSSLTRRAFIAGASAAGLGLAAYAGTHARHEFEITRLSLPIRNLPDAFLNFRFVQISDLHLKEFTEAWFLEEMVRQVNLIDAELVVITGDYVSRGPAPHSFAWKAAGLCAEILSGIKAPQRFGILGNHDVVVGSRKVVSALEAHGTPILIDSYFAVERGRDVLWLCGCDDAGTTHPDFNATIPHYPGYPNSPVILMCHEPDYVDHLRHHPRFPLIDVMLSGHSHGGQIRLPLVGPLILPPLGQKYVQGLFHFDHLQLYVNRGIGTVGLPFRLNCPAEITEITLVRA
jgi:predicted MPP superfamily phosphohydrolase